MIVRKLGFTMMLVAGLAFAACGDDKKDEGEPEGQPDGAGEPAADGDVAAPEAEPTDAAVPEAEPSDAAVPEAEPDAQPEPEPAPWPALPELGDQIDRLGRPAINTALNHTFDGDAATKDAAKIEYNAAYPATEWPPYAAEFAKNLAILDALDGNCGNQLAFGAAGNPGYATLASVLASDDRLYINTDSNACVAFLGLEAQFLGVVPDGGCGGRTLTYDVIDRYYSVLAAGILTGVDDTIAADDVAPLAGFPYVAAPLP
jgi:hypothetical protein